VQAQPDRDILSLMSGTTYRVIPQNKHLFSVEMTPPNGRRRLIPDFRDEAEADAWIIQTSRMLHALDPRDKVTSRVIGKR
jgi:hypothetical protein